MTHEFKNIIEGHLRAVTKDLKTVLASVVALEGSSYRRPGVRMLIREDGKMTGAVSGGCVEKEILRQSQSVFANGKPKLMTYDGRYRLGCEGILYILIEPFSVNKEFLEAFNITLQERKPFTITSYFNRNVEENANFGSYVEFEGELLYPISENISEEKENLETFSQTLKPSIKLIILGAEHDAVQLCALASLNGWEVTIVAPEDDPKTKLNFPGANAIINTSPRSFDYSLIDQETAVVLMNHSFSKDIEFLSRMVNSSHRYIGILGPGRRREKLFDKLLENLSDIDPSFFDSIHAPAGINIGAETPQEIAVSIIAEILAVFREQEVYQLKDKKGSIHAED